MPGKYSNDEVAMKYSRPTLRMLGSGFQLEKPSIVTIFQNWGAYPEMMGFLMASTAAKNDQKSTTKNAMMLFENRQSCQVWVVSSRTGTCCDISQAASG